MALLTALSSKDAQRLLAEYGVELLVVTPLEAGSVNSNFLLEAEDGRELFARIYEEQGPDGATFEIQLNEALHAAGIPVALPLRTRSGDAHLMVSGKPFAVYERVRGEVLCQGRVTTEVAAAVGATLAKVHLADLGELTLPEGRFGFPQIEQRLARVEKSGRADLLPVARDLRAMAEELMRHRCASLPSGLTHGDLFRDNVLIELPGQEKASNAPRIAALLDFESASRGPYVYDLMVALLAWCFGSDFDPALVRAMVRGYQEVRSLTDLERSEMIREGCMACLRFAATRLTDFSLRMPAGEAPSRDFRRFLSRRDMLVGGALDRALQGMF